MAKYEVKGRITNGYTAYSIYRKGRGPMGIKDLAADIAERNTDYEIKWHDDMEVEEQAEFIKRLRKQVKKYKDTYGY